MKHRFYTLLLMVIGIAAATRADDTPQWCLVVESAGGETIAIGADLKPAITTNATGYELTYGDQTTVFTWAELKTLSMKKVEADVNLTPVRDLQTEPGVCIRRGQIAISGAEAGSTAAIYDTTGKRMASANVGTDGSVKLTTTSLPGGIYIVKTNKTTFKIKK